MWGSLKGNHVVVTRADSCTSASPSTGAWGKQIQNLTTRVRANFCGILHKCQLESVNLAMKQLETFNLGFHVLTRSLNSICIIITDNCSEICWWWYNFIHKGNFELNFHAVNFESNQNTTPKSKSPKVTFSLCGVVVFKNLSLKWKKLANVWYKIYSGATGALHLKIKKVFSKWEKFHLENAG